MSLPMNPTSAAPTTDASASAGTGVGSMGKGRQDAASFRAVIRSWRKREELATLQAIIREKMDDLRSRRRGGRKVNPHRAPKPVKDAGIARWLCFPSNMTRPGEAGTALLCNPSSLLSSSLFSLPTTLPSFSIKKPIPRYRDLPASQKAYAWQAALVSAGVCVPFRLGFDKWGRIHGRAKNDPRRFLDFIRRRIARELKIAFGRSVDFWLIPGALNKKGEWLPHVHGTLAIADEKSELDKARIALLIAGGFGSREEVQARYEEAEKKFRGFIRHAVRFETGVHLGVSKEQTDYVSYCAQKNVREYLKHHFKVKNANSKLFKALMDSGCAMTRTNALNKAAEALYTRRRALLMEHLRSARSSPSTPTARKEPK